MDTPHPTRRRRKEVRPQQLLDAALPLFVEKGFAATRAEEVARQAGVSKGTLYLYYPSKEDLFKAVVRHNIAALIGEAGQAVAAASGSTAELMQALLSGWWERVAQSQVGGLHKVVLAEVRNFPELAQFYVDEVVRPARRLFESMIRRGIERGEFRRVDVSATAHAVMAPMIFLMLHKHSFAACPVQGFELDPQAVLAAHADILVEGLRVRAKGCP
ncbi:MAG: TetR family transcriptional regulator [Rubrivivax sp. SCN 71-131]|nr:MAG: TetR family transcriptional regulator [Rubrivivax sp. SCN 71-131]